MTSMPDTWGQSCPFMTIYDINLLILSLHVVHNNKKIKKKI